MSERRERRPERRSRALLLVALACLAALAVWSLAWSASVLEGWWRRPLATPGNVEAFAAAAQQTIERQNRGNAGFALLNDGAVVAQRFVSVGRPVDEDTLFQVASLSKWVTAWGVMKLAEEGRIDLDAPVTAYLMRWRLPESEYDTSGVTVRRLLSHTSGLTDGLAYGGFAPGAQIQSLEASLTRAADASPGADGRVRVGAEPGRSFKYSGGGYTLLQLLIEEVTGESFNDYMHRAILAPLGMTRSTYVLPDDAENVAGFFDANGAEATHYRFTATAAASLYTSVADMTRFLQAQVAGPNGEQPGRGVLSPQTLAQMRRPQAYQFGAEIWGMGATLYAPNNTGDFIIGHDGRNDPAINTSARIDPSTGDGIVVLESGDPRLATNLAGEWVFWTTGHVDLFTVAVNAPRLFLSLAAGWLAIVAVAAVMVWRVAARRRRRARE